ncbi:DedA family protein [Teredinibacter haidensis]|uniref:DedA family protein n=1 Tax=Teredinibacter haidensis TaxID=2731755 RepID=UPI000948D08B|nr:VTT domain-containing protein [Teredinibacter haidensis]
MEDLFALTTQLFGSHWGLLALMIIGFSWLWEDGAVFLAAILALDGEMSLPVAVLASFIGIASGDMALYLLGRVGRRWRWLRKWLLRSRKGRMLRQRFHRRTISNIFLLRFVPGLRTLGFTLCGLWHIPFGRFTVAMVFAGVIWILLIFGLINVAGMSEVIRDSQWKWALMGLALCLLLVNNVWASRMMMSKSTVEQNQ